MEVTLAIPARTQGLSTRAIQNVGLWPLCTSRRGCHHAGCGPGYLVGPFRESVTLCDGPGEYTVTAQTSPLRRGREWELYPQ
jgi:hypothetical protein